MTFERTVFSPRMVDRLSNFSNTSQSAKNLFDMSPNKNFYIQKKNDNEQNNISRPLHCGVETK